MFIFKTPENKNHVKSSLTTEFLFNLKSMIDEKEQEVMMQSEKRQRTNYSDTAKLTRDLQNKSEKCSETAMPCNNTKCRWLQYLHYFYADKVGYWVLPAVTVEDHCEVCRLVNNGIHKMSEFQLSKDLKVCVNGKVLI